MTGLRFPAGTATGLGSMPGVDPRESAAIVTGEVGLPYLPELPERGVGADLIGRTAGLLTELPVDYVHRTYRFSASPTAETRRARDYLRWDLDALDERWETSGFAGEVEILKIQTAGPYTFAAHVELRGGHKVVRDHGAVRDVIDALAEGVATHVAEVERRLGVRVVVQVDEPSIGAVIDGTITPLTRLDPIAPIPVAEVAEGLTRLATQIGRPLLLHSCAAPRWQLIDALGEAVDGLAVSLDLGTIGERDFDALGGYLDGGGVLAAGVVPALDPRVAPDAEELALRVAGLIDRIGLPRRILAENLLVTPACGLAGATTEWTTRALRLSASTARALVDLAHA
ncbi:MAG: vitamin-B12 independent methionine synthase [Gordonia sp. (in: high G+C Gram-positive bacteria)]|uniref:vitamin-B12 independent methionine synthase n=1 Tax=Gordonia sp. (in: high G+C Gram-positive bacteria) TaxID=84139 RepID=UPI003BB7CA31